MYRGLNGNDRFHPKILGAWVNMEMDENPILWQSLTFPMGPIAAVERNRYLVPGRTYRNERISWKISLLGFVDCCNWYDRICSRAQSVPSDSKFCWTHETKISPSCQRWAISLTAGSEGVEGRRDECQKKGDSRGLCFFFLILCFFFLILILLMTVMRMLTCQTLPLARS